MVALNFDASAVQESTGGYGLIEPGEYRAEIVADEVKESKSTAGNHYLELQVKIDGKGSIWDRLNLWNSNPSAVEIANGTLKQIANAIGQSRIVDSAEMLLKPLMVRVEIEPGTAGYKDKNIIVGYSGVGSVAAPQQVAQAAQAPVPPSAPFPTAAPAPTATAPWRS
jgi:hypothetical protein|tara:strand:+ start:1053 stop:1553 length:501 start_codon:yes stop_codon:yes gene_type:complete